MINIDHAKCTICGLCAKICHESCIDLNNHKLSIDYKYCSTCCQCIAICPEQALNWDNHIPKKFERDLYPSPKQVDELLKERRTIRHFKKKIIDKSLLEEVVQYVKDAPTHNFHFRVIIIDTPEIISAADKAICDFSLKLYRYIYKPRLMKWLVQLFSPDMKNEFIKARPKLEKLKALGTAFKTRPAAIILVVGNKGVPLSLESAQYALYNMELFAQSKGLGTRNLVGNQMILNRNKKFRYAIKLGKREKIYATLCLGYPAIKFQNKVTGRDIDIHWN